MNVLQGISLLNTSKRRLNLFTKPNVKQSTKWKYLKSREYHCLNKCKVRSKFRRLKSQDYILSNMR